MAEGTIKGTESTNRLGEATRPEGTRKALTSPLQAMTGWFKARTQSTFESSQEPAKPRKKSLWSRAVGAVTSLPSRISGAFHGAVQTVKDKGVFGALKHWGGQAWTGVKNAVSSVVDTLKNTVKSLTDSIGNFLNKVFTAFSLHRSAVDRQIEEQHREQEKREEKRSVAEHEEARHLEDTVQRARALAAEQEFQAQQGLIDKVTAPAPNSRIDNAALERVKERMKAQKAPR